jgi:hypothetical protein
MEATLFQHPNTAVAITERDQILAQESQAYWIAIGRGKFIGYQRRQPKPPEQFPHWGPRANPAKQLIIFRL